MSGSWICTTCRQRLLREATRSSSLSPRPSRVNFVSLSSDNGQQVPASQRRGDATVRRKRRQLKATVPFQFNSSVEEDFLQRITEDRDPLSGPYSRHRSSFVNGHQAESISAATQSQNEGNTSLPNSPVQAGQPELLHLRSQLSFHIPRAVFGDSREDAAKVDVSFPERLSADEGHVSDHPGALASGAETKGGQDSTLAKHPSSHLNPERRDLSGHTLLDHDVEGRGQRGGLAAEQNHRPACDSLRSASLPALRTDRRQAPATLTTHAATVLASRWCLQEENAPNPSTMIEQATHAKHPPAMALMWKGCLWALLSHAYRGSKGRSVTEIAEEVDRMWSLLLRSQGECNVRDRGTIQQIHGTDDWPKFTLSEQMRQVRQWSSKRLDVRLSTFFSPNIRPIFVKKNQETDLMTLMSLILLDRESACPSFSESTVDRARGFVSFVKHLLPYTDVLAKVSLYEKSLTLRGFSIGVRENISSSIVKVHRGAVTALAGSKHLVESQPINEKRHATSELGQTSNVVDVLKKRIARAFESRNLSRLEALWTETTTTNKELVSAAPPEVALPLFSHYITAFMGLRQVDRAIEVWNNMSSYGLEPKIEHWDAMLRGCGISRDLPALKGLWSRMLASGVRPDAQIWATRMTALFKCRVPDEAVRSFVTMAKEWLKFEQSSRKKAAVAIEVPPKPNLQCLNIVVAGLCRARRYKDLEEALAWAEELDIKADAFTYNPLLQAAVRSGNIGQTVKLLEQMRDCNVKPDVATFTLMLDNIFRNNMSPEIAKALGLDTVEIKESASLAGSMLPAIHESDQDERREARATEQKAIKSIFALMQRQGLEPTAHTFTTLVSGLLKTDQPNITAAYAVLHHLTTQSMPLSAQIYSMLISFHFAQAPPDLVSVEALWHHAREQRRREKPFILDNIFYDRFVGGWASAGNAANAYHAWETARKNGQDVGWAALGSLVQGLVFVGDKAKAQEVIQSVKSRKQEGPHRQRDEFWALVASLRSDLPALDALI